MRKYRRDVRGVQTKGMAPRVSLTGRSVQGEACRDVPTDHEARCRQKQLTSCKTEESLDDSALGGTYAREPSGNKKCCQECHGKRSRGVATLATNFRSLGTMAQVSTWTSEPLVEQHHTTKEV